MVWKFYPYKVTKVSSRHKKMGYNQIVTPYEIPFKRKKKKKITATF